ncbi:RNA polymerase II transcriptional coactivator KELP isoform X1 [Abrus precatorius]|uniref:RNA polymerase II transcriptional coactivator KELP isoform X1 n=1 Tax=Abrus precatorius TaxID=3816 RepID=A0A8B8KIW5_ABRPR|nr:RNA polymerase II transcriptional coactivator KELP isoform X1 [Abrus precatorius]
MDDAETKGRIEVTVRKILQESDMDEVTESKIRKQASNQLGLDLSQPHFKAFVKQVVKAFLQEKQEEEQQQDEEEEEQGGSKDKEYDDDGDLIICKLSERRRVTIQDFKGKTLVSIREFYRKDGKELPTSKGIGWRFWILLIHFRCYLKAFDGTVYVDIMLYTVSCMPSICNAMK